MAQGQGLKTSDAVKSAFLTLLASGLSVSGACIKAGTTTTTMYKYRDTEPEFAKAWADALEAGTDALEDEAHRRALYGVERIKFDRKGNPLINPDTGEPYREREYSDTLTIFLLKGRRPDKYRDNVSVDNRLSGNIGLNHSQLIAQAHNGGFHRIAPTGPAAALPTPPEPLPDTKETTPSDNSG